MYSPINACLVPLGILKVLSSSSMTVLRHLDLSSIGKSTLVCSFVDCESASVLGVSPEVSPPALFESFVCAGGPGGLGLFEELLELGAVATCACFSGASDDEIPSDLSLPLVDGTVAAVEQDWAPTLDPVVLATLLTAVFVDDELLEAGRSGAVGYPPVCEGVIEEVGAV